MDFLIAPYTVTKEQADTAPATGTPGWATDGNPAVNKPATQWPAYAFNAMQEELTTVILAAGLALNRNDNTLLMQAVQALIALKTKQATESALGVVKLATTVQAQAMIDDTAVLTAKKLVDAFTVGQVLAGININQRFPAGAILKTGVFYQGVPSSQNFATPFPNFCAAVVGAESAVASGAAGYVVVQFAGITREGFNAQMRAMDGLFPNAATVRYIAIGY